VSDMPFKSQEQETYLRINEPEIYQRWVDNYGHYNESESFSADFRNHDLPEYEDEDEDGNPIVRKIKRQHSGVGFKNLRRENPEIHRMKIGGWTGDKYVKVKETHEPMLVCLKCGEMKGANYPWGCFDKHGRNGFAHYGFGRIKGFTEDGHIVWKGGCGYGGINADTRSQSDIAWFKDLHECKGAESFFAEKENWPYQDEAKCEIINPKFADDICPNKPTHIVDGWLYSCASCIQNNKWPSDANIQIKRAESFSAESPSARTFTTSDSWPGLFGGGGYIGVDRVRWKYRDARGSVRFFAEKWGVDLKALSEDAKKRLDEYWGNEVPSGVALSLLIEDFDLDAPHKYEMPNEDMWKEDIRKSMKEKHWKKGAESESFSADAKAARSEDEIMEDIMDCYGRLSPENIAADGERSWAEQGEIYDRLYSKLDKLWAEIGREVGEAEAHDWWMETYGADNLILPFADEKRMNDWIFANFPATGNRLRTRKLGVTDRGTMHRLERRDAEEALFLAEGDGYSCNTCGITKKDLMRTGNRHWIENCPGGGPDIIVMDRDDGKRWKLVGEASKDGTPLWCKATSTGKVVKNARRFTFGDYGAGWYDRLLKGERQPRHQPQPKRTELELWKEIYGLYWELYESPENLYEDGEASPTRVKQKIANYKRRIKMAEKELGRKVSPDQAESYAREHGFSWSDAFLAEEGQRVCNICNEIKPTRAYQFGRFVGMYEPVQVFIRDYCDPCAESDGLTITKDAEGIGQWEIGEQLEEAQMNAESFEAQAPRGHKMMTAALGKKIPPLYSQDGKGDEAIVYAHYFNPYGVGEWWILEWDGEDEMFGYADLGFPELGGIWLSELENVSIGAMGLPLERDLHWQEKTLGEVKEAVSKYRAEPKALSSESGKSNSMWHKSDSLKPLLAFVGFGVIGGLIGWATKETVGIWGAEEKQAINPTDPFQQAEFDSFPPMPHASEVIDAIMVRERTNAELVDRLIRTAGVPGIDVFDVPMLMRRQG